MAELTHPSPLMVGANISGPFASKHAPRNRVLLGGRWGAGECGPANHQMFFVRLGGLTEYGFRSSVHGHPLLFIMFRLSVRSRGKYGRTVLGYWDDPSRTVERDR